MNLGELKAIVNEWCNDSYEFQAQTFMNPHSYRGYYNELAFEYCDCPLTVADIKCFVREAGTDTFTGWKGGEYTYDDDAPIHLSRQGDANDEEGHDFTELVFEMDREYRGFNSKVCYNTPMETNTGTKMTAKRKTAAEKRAEAEALQLEQQRQAEETFRTEYQTRLLQMVGLFMKNQPFRVKFDSESFESFVFDVDQYADVYLPLVLDPTESSWVAEDLNSVESYHAQYVKKLEEERVRAEKKSAALAKLTKEERELLGL